MAKTLKTWTALGVAILAGAGSVEAGMMSPQPTLQSPSLILVDGEGGEAEQAKEKFRLSNKSDRDALIAFLKSL